MRIFIHDAASRALAAEMIADLDLAKRWTVQVSDTRRTDAQNRHLHALCNDFAHQVEHCGRRYDAEAWKRLLVDSWAREAGRVQSQFVPSLDGRSLLHIGGIRTSRLGKRDFAELVDFIVAAGVERGVKFSAPAWREVE